MAIFQNFPQKEPLASISNDGLMSKEDKLKIKILKELALIYYFNNHRLPDGFELELTEDIE